MDTLCRAMITYITEEQVHIIYSFNRVMTLSLAFCLVPMVFFLFLDPVVMCTPM